MADDLRQWEDVTQRQKPDVRQSVKFWRRVYKMPYAALSTTVPVNGTAVDLDGLDTQTGILRYRVFNSQESQANQEGWVTVAITFYQTIPYS